LAAAPALLPVIVTVAVGARATEVITNAKSLVDNPVNCERMEMICWICDGVGSAERTRTITTCDAAGGTVVVPLGQKPVANSVCPRGIAQIAPIEEI
jgi:hypothetical protein